MVCYSIRALHLAALKGKQKIVKLLLENGAQIEVKDNYGRIPLDLVQTEQLRRLLHYTKN